MAEMKTDIDVGGEKDDTFMTDAVHANRDIQSGLGIGARELAAQRDAHGAQVAAETAEGEDDDDLEDADAGAEKSRQEDA